MTTQIYKCSNQGVTPSRKDKGKRKLFFLQVDIHYFRTTCPISLDNLPSTMLSHVFPKEFIHFSSKLQQSLGYKGSLNTKLQCLKKWKELVGLFPFMISSLRLHRSKREERKEGGKIRQEARIHRKNVQGAFYGKGWLV